MVGGGAWLVVVVVVSVSAAAVVVVVVISSKKKKQKQKQVVCSQPCASSKANRQQHGALSLSPLLPILLLLHLRKQRMLGGEVGRRRAIVFARIAVFLREAMVLYLGSSTGARCQVVPLACNRLLTLPDCWDCLSSLQPYMPKAAPLF